MCELNLIDLQKLWINDERIDLKKEKLKIIEYRNR